MPGYDAPGGRGRLAEPATGERILTGEALEFVADLQREFGRAGRSCSRGATSGSSGFRPVSCPTSSRRRRVRESEWRVAAAPADLQDRRVEITGPADRKMVINALNSGAKVFMADFEDANSPTWTNWSRASRT